MQFEVSRPGPIENAHFTSARRFSLPARKALPSRTETMNFLRSHGLFTLRSTRPKTTRSCRRSSKLQATRSMFAFMARTARTGSNATSRRPSDSKHLYSERELQSLAKGFGNLEQQGVKRAYAIFNNCYQNSDL